MPATSTMKAAVYRGRNEIRVESVPIPTPGPREILVRVGACGIASSDVKKVEAGHLPPPQVIGHEIAGTVEVVGDEVEGWDEGDRVAVYSRIPCGQCFYCERDVYAQCEQYARAGTTAGFEPAGGGFAEFVLVKPWIVEGDGLVAIPKQVSFEEAIFVEPVNACLRGIRLLDLDEEDVVLVAGVGSLGLLVQQLAIREGASVVAADPLAGHLSLAAELGAVRTVNPTTEDMHEPCKELTEGRGADAAIVAAVGAGPVRDAIRATRAGARILLLAQIARGDEVAVDMGDICVDEKRIIGSFSASADEAEEAAEVVFRREIELARLITHRFSLADAAAAFKKAAEPTDEVVKVVIVPAAKK